MPGSMDIFNQLRPRDINLEFPLSDKEEELTYYLFNEPALNTVSEKEAMKKNGVDNFKIIRKEQLHTKTLANIVEKYLPKG